MNLGLSSRWWKRKPAQPRRQQPATRCRSLRLEPLEERALPTITALQTPLHPAALALSQLVTELTDPGSGAIGQVEQAVNNAEASVSAANPAGNVAAAKTALNQILAQLGTELSSAAGSLRATGLLLPAAVSHSLAPTAQVLGGALQDFGSSLSAVAATVTTAASQVPGLSVSTLIGAEIAGLPGAAPPTAVNAFGQDLVSLLGSVASNSSAFLNSLNTLDGAATVSGTIQGVVTSNTGTPVANVAIQLVDATGVVVQSTSTSSAGAYSFAVSRNGAYAVREVTPAGYQQLTPTFASAAPAAQGATANFGYYGPTTLPYDWTDGAAEESPINLTGPTADLSRLSPQLHSGQAGSLAGTVFAGNATTVNNTGFQLKVTFNAGTAAPTIVVNGDTYTLAQFHFHDPSENTVNGYAYPMEEHLVFTDANGAELVVGVFVQVGAANSSFQSILNAAGGLTTAATTAPVAGAIHLSDLLPSGAQGWYFQGSLTTPPLSLPVNWLELATPITISAAQLQTYEGDAGVLGFLPNARPVQPANGRQLNEIDNYVNYQGQTVTGVNFVIKQTGPAATPGQSNGGAQGNIGADVLNTATVAAAGGLNNVAASANSLSGVLFGTTASNGWSLALLANVEGDVLGYRNSAAANLNLLASLTPAVTGLPGNGEHMLLEAELSELPATLDATGASLGAIAGTLPVNGGLVLRVSSQAIRFQLAADANDLGSLAGGLRAIDGLLPGVPQQRLKDLAFEVEFLIDDATRRLLSRGSPTRTRVDDPV